MPDASFLENTLLTVIAAAPALLAPIIGWLINRAGAGRKLREVEWRMRQLELLEKAASVGGKTGDAEGRDRVRAAVDEAIDDILAHIAAQRTPPEAAERTCYDSLSWPKRLLLIFRPYSVKGWVYRVLYYVFLYFLMMMPLTFYWLSTTDELASQDLPLVVPSLIFYLILAIVFHRLAVADARRHEKAMPAKA